MLQCGLVSQWKTDISAGLSVFTIIIFMLMRHVNLRELKSMVHYLITFPICRHTNGFHVSSIIPVLLDLLFLIQKHYAVLYCYLLMCAEQDRHLNIDSMLCLSDLVLFCLLYFIYAKGPAG